MPPVQSWSDVAALTMLVGIMAGGLAWGLKLEFRLDKLREDVHRILRKLRIEDNGE